MGNIKDKAKFIHKFGTENNKSNNPAAKHLPYLISATEDATHEPNKTLDLSNRERAAIEHFVEPKTELSQFVIGEHNRHYDEQIDKFKSAKVGQTIEIGKHILGHSSHGGMRDFYNEHLEMEYPDHVIKISSNRFNKLKLTDPHIGGIDEEEDINYGEHTILHPGRFIKTREVVRPTHVEHHFNVAE